MKFAHQLLLAFAFCASASSQTITTIAGTGEPGFSGDGGPAKSALFNDPRHLAVDAAGNVYVIDTNNVRIRKISSSGVVTTVAGNGEAAEPTKGAATRSGLLGMGGLAVTANGMLYIADATGLQKVDPSGTMTFVVTGQSVQGVAVAGASTVYLTGVSDVSVLGPKGTVKRLAGTDVGDSGDGGPALKAKFFVSHAAIDPAGNIYVADKEAHRIRKFTPQGTISTFAGNGSAGFRGDGGPASQSQLNRPESIAIDVAGNVYIADTENYRIRRVSTEGVITTLAGSGVNERKGDGGPAVRASFGAPFDVAVGCAGVYVTDIQSVRKITMTDPLIAYNGVTSAAGKPALTAAKEFSITGCNLAGATVTINGVSTPLSSSTNTRLTGTAPTPLAAGPAKVIVTVTGKPTAQQIVSVK